MNVLLVIFYGQLTVHNLLQDLIFTPTCIGCGRFGISVCSQCLANLDPPQVKQISNVDEVICVGDYSGWLKEALIEYKSGKYQLARGLAETLLEKPLSQIEPFVVVPIPTSDEKIKLRQIDTISNLATFLNRLDRRYRVVKSLAITKKVTDQVGLNEHQRFINLQGAFSAKTRVPETVILLDDVITTGATMSAAAQALKIAGAKRVIAVGLCAASKVH